MQGGTGKTSPPHSLKKPCHCEPVTDVTGVAIRIPVPTAPFRQGRLLCRAEQSTAPTHLFPHPTQKRGGRAATSYKFSVAELLLLQLPYQSNMQLVRLLLHSPQNGGAFCGVPSHKFQSSAEVNSACGFHLENNHRPRWGGRQSRLYEVK